LALKDNQGTLYEDVKDTFLLAQKEGFRNTSHQSAEKTEKNHGRVETRKHWMIDDETCLKYLNFTLFFTLSSYNESSLNKIVR
jgi:hypothetical protein